MNKKLKFKFTDAHMIQAEPTDISAWKDSFGNTFNDNRNALRVTIEATHAALINRNIRWYIPSKMNDGAATFINGNKPAKVLKNHDVYKDPVGVVRDSRFVSTVPEDLENNPDVQVLMSESAEIKDQINSMKRLIKSGITSRPDWRGLGYIELIADILEKETIAQITDGRFDAVSTSFNSPGHAYCMICAQNWGEDGMCEHTDIGELYEDEDGEEWPMMLIPGLHDYDEVSLVVKDADPITAIQISDSIKDSKSKIIDYEDAWMKSLPVSECKFEFKDSIKEDKLMPKTKLKEIADKAKAVLDLIKPIRSKLDEKVLADFATKISELQLEDGSYKNQKEAGIDESMAVKYVLETLELADKDVDAKVIYKAMTAELKDKEKLEEEAIKKLSDSTFCGPNRSFPCPDSAHVKAALAVLDSVECSNKIETLVKLKTKEVALGKEETKSDSEKDADATFVMPASVNALEKLSDQEVLILCAMADQAGATRKLKMKAECSKCAENLTKAEEAVEIAKEVSSQNEDSLNILSVLREELKFHQADYVHQIDKFIVLETELRAAKEEKLAIIGTLGGKYKSTKSAMDSLKGSNIDALETSIMDSFDLAAAAKRLNDGTSKDPECGLDPLKDPTKNGDKDNLQLPEGLSGPGAAAMESIRDMLAVDDEQGAQILFNNMKSKNIFPEDLTFETISTDSSVD